MGENEKDTRCKHCNYDLQKEVKNEKIRARDVSLVGKVVGMLIILFTVAILIVLLVLKIITPDMAETIFSFSSKGALSILALFGTVDINLAIDKLTNRH